MRVAAFSQPEAERPVSLDSTNMLPSKNKPRREWPDLQSQRTEHRPDTVFYLLAVSSFEASTGAPCGVSNLFLMQLMPCSPAPAPCFSPDACATRKVSVLSPRLAWLSQKVAKVTEIVFRLLYSKNLPFLHLPYLEKFSRNRLSL